MLMLPTKRMRIRFNVGKLVPVEEPFLVQRDFRSAPSVTLPKSMVLAIPSEKRRPRGAHECWRTQIANHTASRKMGFNAMYAIQNTVDPDPRKNGTANHGRDAPSHVTRGLGTAGIDTDQDRLRLDIKLIAGDRIFHRLIFLGDVLHVLSQRGGIKSLFLI